MVMIDFNEIPAEGERWLQFAQEFMQQLGFHTEMPAYRDPENANDFCAVEQVRGRFNVHPFRWLVSCRHKTATRTAVKESEEASILDRVLRCKADGFLGFYSTPVSPALGFYLSELKAGGQIKDYRFFDSKFIENFLTTPGFGRIASRYFPNYSKTYRPIDVSSDEYLPILCDHCGVDLLETLFSEDRQGVAVRLQRRRTEPDEMQYISDVYFACKGECDEQLQSKYCNGSHLSAASWLELSDLTIPVVYLEQICVLLDQIGKDEASFSTSAIEKEEYLIRALGQRTLRESTEGEKQKAAKIKSDGR